MYLYTKSIAMTLCSVTVALAVALTGLTEEPSTPDASSMPYPASQSQTAGMPDSSTVPGPTSETAPGATGTADSAISEAPGPDAAQQEESGVVPTPDIEAGGAGVPDASPDLLKGYSNLYVTPKNMDFAAAQLSGILSGALNRYLHRLSAEALRQYLY